MAPFQILSAEALIFGNEAYKEKSCFVMELEYTYWYCNNDYE